jgi:hypothetical protein
VVLAQIAIVVPIYEHHQENRSLFLGEIFGDTEMLTAKQGWVIP